MSIYLFLILLFNVLLSSKGKISFFIGKACLPVVSPREKVPVVGLIKERFQLLPLGKCKNVFYMVMQKT